MIRRKYISSTAFFSKVIGVSLDDRPYKEEAEAAVEEFLKKYGSIRVAIGEMMNGDVFDMAAALSKYEGWT